MKRTQAKGHAAELVFRSGSTLFDLSSEISTKHVIIKTTKGNGPVQRVKVGESIRHNLIKYIQVKLFCDNLRFTFLYSKYPKNVNSVFHTFFG